MNNILITSAGRRVSLVKSFIEEINKLSINTKVFCTDLEPTLSSACLVADDSFQVARVTEKNYIDELLNICMENRVKIVIPTIDTELKILAENRGKFLANNIEILVSDIGFIEKCRDKRLIHSFFDEINFDRAKEFNKNKVNYPIFVKPSDGSRSVGIHLLHSASELTDEIANNPKNMFLEYFPQTDYDEFTVDIYCNKNSEVISITPRERIFVRDGEVNKACTRKNEIVSFVKDKFKNVKGLRGCITLQVFKHKKESKIIGIEINPRFGGGYPLSYLAGANFPKWIIQEYIQNKEVSDYFDDWTDNLLMLRYDAEVLSYDYKG
ncbi:MAG: ATP-grasp domain-containing protein [Flavobacteriaceae bacterium]|nr:ATP-grasp domain-containing protein [Flavobacteriaceae bacterium]